MRTYTWGLDLAGLNGSMGGVGVSPANSATAGADLESAGGIGGLLAMHDPDSDGPENPGDVDRDFAVLYDANGNVTQLVAWAEDYAGTADYAWDTATPSLARLAARYEYDPYGNPIASAGDYAAENPWRFSTKQWDDETGLGYWGKRYYDPGVGRWISRDAMGEVNANLYRAFRNDSLYWVDPDGRDDLPASSAFQPENEPTSRRGTGPASRPTSQPGTQPQPKPASQPGATQPSASEPSREPQCNPEYPPPDPPPGRDYDCVGLACRDYSHGRSPDDLLNLFRKLDNCSESCNACEIKCWQWDYTLEIYDPTGELYTALRAGHIVCGQVGPHGEEPTCYNKNSVYGTLSQAPGPCAGFKPTEAGDQFEIGQRNVNIGYTLKRKDIEEHCYCGCASALKKLPGRQ